MLIPLICYFSRRFLKLSSVAYLKLFYKEFRCLYLTDWECASASLAGTMVNPFLVYLRFSSLPILRTEIIQYS